LGFTCQVAGVPQNIDALRDHYFEPAAQIGMDRYAVIGCIAGLDCWEDAGFSRSPDSTVDWDTGIVFGSGIGGIETIGKTVAPMTDSGRVRRMGSAMPERMMGSAVSARLGGLVGAGGQVTSNSSACATSTESIINGYWMVREGRVARVLAGGCEGDSPYAWAGFDAMRVLSRNFNDEPERASRSLSATACGFVPSAGAGALMLEDLESALARGARIYAEVAGGAVNCGGQRNGGTMTFPNPEGVRRCIQSAVQSAGVKPEEIDLISGHLTATKGDPIEVNSWRCALDLPPERFPLLNAPKSLFGHALGAAGAIECVACILQLQGGFVHPSLNCEDLHPDIAAYAASIPLMAVRKDLRLIAKSSFGFGDVNACILFRKYIN
jgi:3-oxoacyl-(acyl-carrier-protein) synthase